MDMYSEAYGYPRRSFKRTYHCYPLSYIDKQHFEGGDKIIMPLSALEYLASLHIDYPMLFMLSNSSADRVSHCGVLEFTAEEGKVFMPYWMMQNLLLQEGDNIIMKSATLSKGTFVKLQPHTKDFLDISNPKAVLEKTLRGFSCLTTGDTVMVAYNNKNYYIDIVETKPSSAITIIETDCEVDFAPPLDYKEPEKPAASNASGKNPVEDDLKKVEPNFSSFTGTGRRLNGKPSTTCIASTSSASLEPQKASSNWVGSTSTSTSCTPARSPGNLVFGSKTAKVANHKETEKVSASPQSQKEEESKFKAFTGKKYSLKS